MSSGSRGCAEGESFIQRRLALGESIGPKHIPGIAYQKLSMSSIRCRMCGSNHLEEFLHLGHHPPANSLLSPAALKEPETHYPLTMLLCLDCALVQLGYVVPKEVLFGAEYPYDTSASRTLREHFDAMATALTQRFALGAKDLVVDIGSNVGVLPGAVQALGVRALGIEPAQNMAAKANALGIETIHGFFSEALASQVVGSHGQASVITATNVFAHIDDLQEVVAGVRALLAPHGAFTIEVQYFLDMVRHLEYDQIYHEHYSYMTLHPLVRFFTSLGLEVFDVERIATHGGSLRVFSGLPGKHPIDTAVGDLLQEEETAGVNQVGPLVEFGHRVAKSRDALVELLVTLKSKGKRTVGIGAPAKASTLLNYANLSDNLIEFLTDSAPSKVGLHLPGVHIPVVPESRLSEEQPDYAILMAWNIKQELMAKFASFERSGGRFIVPVPEPAVLGE